MNQEAALSSRLGRQAATTWGAMAMIVVAGVAAYSNSLHGPFVFDDISSITENESIRSLGDSLLPSDNLNYYRPTLNVSLALCYGVGGLDVVPYHVLNLVIHILAALTLFGLIRRTLLLPTLDPRFGEASTPLALGVSLLWMLHPLQPESVTYVIQRCEALMGLFCLLAVYCVLRGAGSSHARSWYVGAVVACALGMGTKEVMAMVPLLILLFDRVFLAGSLREAIRKRWGLYLTLVLTSLILVPMILAARGSQVTGPLQAPTTWKYASSQFAVIAHYLRLTIWPDSLCLDYTWPVAKSAREIVPPAIVIGVLFLVTVWALCRWPKWGFLGAVFFVTIAPSSSVISIPDLAFEHRMYLPLAPLVAAMVLGGYVVCRKLGQSKPLPWPAVKACVACLAVVIATALAIRTYLRNQDYSSDLAIWRDTVTKAPNNFRAHNNMGIALADRGNIKEAIARYQRALELNPRYAEAHYNLGTALAGQERVDEAITHYNKALEIYPSSARVHYNLGAALIQQGKLDEAIAHYRKAAQLDPNDADTHHNLGTALVQQGRIDEAIAHYRRTLELAPNDAEAYRNLGIVLVQQRRFDEAITHYQENLELDHNPLETHYNLGVAYEQKGMDREAVAHWREALRLDPNQVVILVQTAWALATSPDASVRNGAEATVLAERAVQLSGDTAPILLDALAAAYAETGRFSEATQTAQQALEMAASQTNTILADALRDRIKLYQAGSAFCDSKQGATASQGQPR